MKAAAGVCLATITPASCGRLGLLLAALLLALPARADITFAIGQSFEVPNLPQKLAAGDFDADGNQDLMALTTGADGLTIAFGDGQGGFRGWRQVAVAPRIVSFVVDDINGDGRPDIAVATNYQDQAFALLAQGNGFRPLGALRDAKRLVDIAVGKIDRQEGKDVVLIAQDPGSVSVFGYRPSSNGFIKIGNYPVGNRPRRVLTGDLNGDGSDDIVVLSLAAPSEEEVSVFLNLGDGRFSPYVSYPGGSRVQDIAIGDVNDDGALDILVLNGRVASDGNTLTVSLLLNVVESGETGPRPTGRFESAPAIVTTCPYGFIGTPIWCEPQYLVVADFNGDAFLDFAISFHSYGHHARNLLPGFVAAYVGSGDAGFARSLQVGVGTMPTGLVAVDFNGDGIVDVGVAEQLDRSVRVLRSLLPDAQVTGARCTEPRQCLSGFCVDGACCLLPDCPQGQICNVPGVAGVCQPVPSPGTATPVPTPSPTATIDASVPSPTPTSAAVGVPCDPEAPEPCPDGLFCTDATCCLTAECLEPQRCDIFDAPGICTAPLLEGEPCTKDSDCQPPLVCTLDAETEEMACASLPSTTPTPTASPEATRTAAPICTEDCDCPGDCDGDSEVTVDELLLLVRINLEEADASLCPAGDANGDGTISIDDLLAATGYALTGCPLTAAAASIR